MYGIVVIFLLLFSTTHTFVHVHVFNQKYAGISTMMNMYLELTQKGCVKVEVKNVEGVQALNDIQILLNMITVR